MLRNVDKYSEVFGVCHFSWRCQRKSLLTGLSVRGYHYNVHEALHVGQHSFLVTAGVFVHPLNGLSLPVRPVDPAVLLRESGERG